MSWADRMRQCHTAADGFSATERAEEHFTTSVDIGNHVARVILGLAVSVADRCGLEPEVVDVGSGSGRLLRQLVDLGMPAHRLTGVDVRPRPDGLPVGVQWVQGVAPGAVPGLCGVLVAHEFLDDIPVEVIDGSGCAEPADLVWLDQWGGPVSGRRRDDAWAELVSRVACGIAVAVDWMGGSVVGHRRGRRLSAAEAGGADLSAGVDLRACRARTGGRLVPQHRVLAGIPAESLQERSELAVLRDRSGLGAFGWLITQCHPLGSPA